VSLTATMAVAAVLMQGGASDARTFQPKPSLAALVAQVKQLSNEVDTLGQQYDGLQIQIAHAKTEERLAKLAASRAQAAMAGSQKAVAQLAAMGYMNGGMDPTLQMLTSGDPSVFLNQASTVMELGNQASAKLTQLQRTQLASARAQLAAKQQIATVNALQKEVSSKAAAIHAKLAVLNSSAMAQALAVYQQTGTYPPVVLPLASTVELVALRAALTKVGRPYVWGAAGPDYFDCSGLVVWAYATEGISLPHYTGYLWNSGMHVSQADLEPGDLIFFGADLGHVAFYLGNGMMLDAPSTGLLVRVEPVWWSSYAGAVRIA
jgi:cell wall-associated NlpC family hydrolase